MRCGQRRIVETTAKAVSAGFKYIYNMEQQNYDDDVKLDWYDDDPVEMPEDDDVLESYYDFG